MNSAPRRAFALGLLAVCSTAWTSCSGREVAPELEGTTAPGGVSVTNLPTTAMLPVQEKPGPRVKLTQILESNYDGRDTDTSEIRARYERQARIYVRYRSGLIKGPQRKALVAACDSTNAANRVEAESGLDPRGAFCADIETHAFGAGKARSRRHEHRVRQDAEIRAALFKGNLKALANRREVDISHALKKVTNLSKIKPTVDAVLASKDCQSPALLAALGFEHEESFPNDEAVALASALYQRALECGNGNDVSAMKAGYRLGLIHMWKGRLTDAETTFTKIVDQPAATDYRVRSLYWKAQCAKARGDLVASKEFRAKLVKEAPLSLHAMLIEPSVRTMTTDPTSSDPLVTYRSLLKPDLNDAVRAAEAVQALGKSEYSNALLATLGADKIGEAEPSFQLYYAVLYKRAGEVIKKFQLLSGLMRSNPESISRPALELFYPLHSFDMIKAHEETADPFLVVALIRQESAFNTRAHSSAGAMGLMQLMPGTARRVAHVNKHKLYDPETNIKVGVRYFSQLIDRFDGDAELALASYNAGPLRVDEWVKRYPVANRLLFLDLIPFRETRDYVASIARNYYWYSHLYDVEGANRAVAGSTPAAPGAAQAGPAATPSPAMKSRATLKVLSLLES